MSNIYFFYFLIIHPENKLEDKKINNSLWILINVNEEKCRRKIKKISLNYSKTKSSLKHRVIKWFIPSVTFIRTFSLSFSIYITFNMFKSLFTLYNSLTYFPAK